MDGSVATGSSSFKASVPSATSERSHRTRSHSPEGENGSHVSFPFADLPFADGLKDNDSASPGSDDGGEDESDEGANSEDAESSNEQSIDIETDSEYEVIEIPASPQEPASRPSAAPEGRKRPKRRRFILHRSKRSRKEKNTTGDVGSGNGYSDRFDYDKKYPEDPWWLEREPEARIWRVYLDEAAEYDNDMVENYKDTIDVILVFAGLFSAVVTTLAVQASINLQSDYAQIMASILHEQLAIQRAIANGERAPKPLSSTLGLDSSTSSSSDRWVNGLWFTSLAFSLTTALIGVLVKQWIQAYSAPLSGAPRDQARLRHYRFTGLHQWHVPLIIGLLPTLLHLSLLLFLLGLVVFLFNLDHTIASVVAGITLLAYSTYFLTNLLPIFDPQCPYKTPLTTYAYVSLRPLFLPIRDQFRNIMHVSGSTLRVLLSYYHDSSLSRRAHAAHHALVSLAASLRILPPGSSSFRSPPPNSSSSSPNPATSAPSLRESELAGIEETADEADAEMLCWLIRTSSNRSVGRVVMRTLANLPPHYPGKDILRKGGIPEFICSAFQSSFDKNGDKLPQFEESYSFIDTLWAHRSLPPLDLDSAGVPTFSCPDSCSTDPDRRCSVLYNKSQLDRNWAEIPDPGCQIQGVLVFSRSPHFMDTLQRKSSKTSKAYGLRQLRSATLFLRSSLEKTHQKEWSACYSLFQLVPLHYADFVDGLLALRQVLMSSYLSYQFVPPTPGEPLLVTDILLDRTLTTALSQQRQELWLISFTFRVSFLSSILTMFLEEPSTVEDQWWGELTGALRTLADAAQEHNNLFDPAQYDFIEWLSTSLSALSDPLVQLLTKDPDTHDSDHRIPLVDLAACAILLEPTYKELPGLPVEALPRLLRLLIQDLHDIKIQDDHLPNSEDEDDYLSTSGNRLVQLCAALSKLLNSSSRSRPAELTEIFREADVLNILQRIFSEDTSQGPLLAKCADQYIRTITQRSSEEGNTQGVDADTEYISKHLRNISVWFMPSEWDPKSALVGFLQGQAVGADCWEDTLSYLKARELVTDNEKEHGPKFINHLERELKLKVAKANRHNTFTLVASATFASMTNNRPIKSFGQRLTLAFQKLIKHSQRGTRSSDGDSGQEEPQEELDLPEVKGAENRV